MTSSITGRTVFVNLDADRFAIVPGADLAHLDAARAEWTALLRSESGRLRYLGPKATATVIRAFLAVQTMDDLARCVDALVDHFPAASELPQGALKRCVEFLALLWRHGLVAFPAGLVFSNGPLGPHSLPQLGFRHYGPIEPFLRRWNGTLHRPAKMFPLVVGGVTEIGDIDGAVLQSLRRTLATTPPNASWLAD